MRGGRKSERLRERDRSGKRGLEWMEVTTIRSGGFGGGVVEWSGLVVDGGQISQRVGELGGARLVIGC